VFRIPTLPPHRRIRDYHRFFTDRVHNLWVPRFRPKWSEEDTIWRIFDDEGVLMATLVMPYSVFGNCDWAGSTDVCLFSILEIGDDYLLIRARGEYGVVRVKVLRLRKQ